MMLNGINYQHRQILTDSKEQYGKRKNKGYYD